MTVRRQSCELIKTLALSTEQSRRERFSARPNANVAIRAISGVEYDSVSQARSTPFSVAFPRSPKYIPPASSRTISRSRSPRRSGLRGEIPFSGSRSFTGRTLMYSPSPFRKPSSPLSGRFPTGNESHFGPPTAPRITASAFRQASSVSFGRGVPAASMAAPPIGSSRNSNSWLNSCAVSRRIVAAARDTSGPMPSPGNRMMVFFIKIPGQMQKLVQAVGATLRGETRQDSPVTNYFSATERSGCGGRFRRYHRGTAADDLVGDRKDVASAHQLRLIGQRGYAGINLRQFRIARLETQIAQRLAERIAARMFSKNERARRDADTLRRNDFVRQRVLDDSVLVDSRFVCERIGAHDGFVRRDLRAGDFREHATCGEEFFEPDSRRHAKTFLAHREGDYHFFKRCVPGAFADSVDGALDLPDSRANGCQRIGDRHAQVVVTMRAERNAVRIAEVLTHPGEHRTVFFRHRVSHRIRQVQHCRAGIHRGTAHLAKKLDVGSSGIFGGELDLADVLTSMANHRSDGFKRLFAGHIELYAEMQIGGSEENVQTGGGRRLQGFHGRIHILFFGASERRNRHGADFLCDFLDRFEVSARRNRKSRFDHIHIQGRQLACQADLLLRVHREARRLLAVTERSVKDAYDVHRVSHPVVTHGRGLVVQFIFILLLIILSYTVRA